MKWLETAETCSLSPGTLNPVPMSSKDWIGYENLVDNAHRSIVREALRHVARGGIMGNHHFYITFDTTASGVVLSDVMKAQFPELITIVLQNKFWDLKVSDDAFEVGLSFNKMPEILRVPFHAIRQFADPSQNFGFPLRAPDGKLPAVKPTPGAAAAPKSEPEPRKEVPPVGDKPDPDPTPDPTVISLDRFRKK